MSAELNIPTAGQAKKKFGSNPEDYNKYVVVDENGILIENGGVVIGFDLLKDDTEEGIKSFIGKLFEAVGMKVELRTGRKEKTIKAVDPKDIMALIAKGKL